MGVLNLLVVLQLPIFFFALAYEVTSCSSNLPEFLAPCLKINEAPEGAWICYLCYYLSLGILGLDSKNLKCWAQTYSYYQAEVLECWAQDSKNLGPWAMRHRMLRAWDLYNRPIYVAQCRRQIDELIYDLSHWINND